MSSSTNRKTAEVRISGIRLPSDRQTGLSGNGLKLIACVCMLADHGAKTLHAPAALHFILSDVVGRISFPLFCFLLVEGYFHTGNLRRYLSRLFALALLSEIPFDLAMKGKLFDLEWQNTVWLLFTGLLMCHLLTGIREKGDLHYRAALLLQLGCVILFAALAYLLHLDYGAEGIGAIAFLYYLHGRLPGNPRKEALLALFWACLVLNGITLEAPFTFLSLLPVYFYNRQAGSGKFKTFFYLFYPLHLLLLILAAHLLQAY